MRAEDRRLILTVIRIVGRKLNQTFIRTMDRKVN